MSLAALGPFKEKKEKKFIFTETMKKDLVCVLLARGRLAFAWCAVISKTPKGYVRQCRASVQQKFECQTQRSSASSNLSLNIQSWHRVGGLLVCFLAIVICLKIY